MRPASWLVLHPSQDKPLAPVTLCQAIVVFLVKVECRHRFQILRSQPRRQRRRCVRVAEGMIEPTSTETRKGTVAGIAGHCSATSKLMARWSVLHRQRKQLVDSLSARPAIPWRISFLAAATTHLTFGQTAVATTDVRWALPTT